MNTKISAIFMALVIAMVGVPQAMAEEVTGTVVVGACSVPTDGIRVNTNTLNFGSLKPGYSSSAPLGISATATGYDSICNPNGGSQPLFLPVSIALSEWKGTPTTETGQNIMSADATEVSASVSLSEVISSTIPEVITLNGEFPIGTTTVTFTVTPPVGTIADTYTQIITVTLTS